MYRGADGNMTGSLEKLFERNMRRQDNAVEDYIEDI